MEEKTSIRITGEERKKQLMGVGLRLFLENGFDETTVDEIVREAGVAKGTFYIYFSSKEELFGELYLRISQRALDAVAEVIDTDKSAWEKIDALMKIPPGALREFKEFLVLFHRSSTDIEIARRKFEINTRILRYAVDLINQGIEEGTMELDNPEMTAFLFMEMAWEAAHYAIILDKPVPAAETPLFIMDAIRKLLRTGKKPAQELLGQPFLE